jgi:spermidine synthase
MFKTNTILTGFNQNSLNNQRLPLTIKTLHLGAKNRKNLMVIIDFPDPSNYSLGKLYCSTFATVQKSLHPDVVVSQTTSALFAPKSFGAST